MPEKLPEKIKNVTILIGNNKHTFDDKGRVFLFNKKSQKKPTDNNWAEFFDQPTVYVLIINIATPEIAIFRDLNDIEFYAKKKDIPEEKIYPNIQEKTIDSSGRINLGSDNRWNNQSVLILGMKTWLEIRPANYEGHKISKEIKDTKTETRKNIKEKKVIPMDV